MASLPRHRTLQGRTCVWLGGISIARFSSALRALMTSRAFDVAESEADRFSDAGFYAIPLLCERVTVLYLHLVISL